MALGALSSAKMASNSSSMSSPPDKRLSPCVRSINTPESGFWVSMRKAIPIIVLRLAMRAESRACEARRSISSTLLSQASASRCCPTLAQMRLKSSRHSFCMWNFISARSKGSVIAWKKASSRSENSRDSSASKCPEVRWKLLLDNLAFFIFFVKRDCLDLSILPRNSLSLTPSVMGSSPVSNLAMSLSQYAISSFVQRPVRRSDT
mmetsp:Transcript_18362/g.35087  ORF Transcript_18362/g.35087 Transcript_18362/m.35087 type:complete len:206 (+) Transcript_18362:1540-2157(+)